MTTDYRGKANGLRALDLFCGAGGASGGLAALGFDVTGVDIAPQKRYPYRFIQADALDVNLDGYDLIWASPPCQAYTALRTRWPERTYPDLVQPVRERLQATGTPYVIENVEGAPLDDPTLLCGTMFGLGTAWGELRRHRIFEASFRIHAPRPCHHVKPAVGVYGHSGGVENRRPGSTPRSYAHDWREAMGIDWMSRDELAQSIPPAFSEWLGSLWLLRRYVDDLGREYDKLTRQTA